MNDDPRGAIVQQGNIMRIDNALVEDTSCFDNSRGSIEVSYSVPEANNITSIQTIRLNLTGNTVILDSFGQNMCICCIQPGMWVSAIFSARMTRSIPPQSNAFLIIVQGMPQAPSVTTTDRVIFADVRNNMLLTGIPWNINSQTRFVVPNSTPITNRAGRPVQLSALRPGQLVRITHANFQTASIPPQTTAYSIQIL
ncbi:hypothetical protein [Qiania dongpingensis]|uniref:Uncharacterized protein n=1 Tax=Qiania dongpingensis TaxID=2763669 RepID=A0A7G9G5F7_9FIRM|nr:hypothetical protein [Qiania dongpingensis]QNM06039.1 hypothetical protein H9Q78_02405 [Qiania dongpingensis]